MFVPLSSRNLARSARERGANGLVYSRCPANTNDLATPLIFTICNSAHVHNKFIFMAFKQTNFVKSYPPQKFQPTGIRYRTRIPQQIDYLWSSYYLLWQECTVTLYHCRQCIPQETLAVPTGARSLWYSSEEKKVGEYVLW